MMEKLHDLRIKFIAARHGNPQRGQNIIGVAGPYGKTTTVQLLEGILKEAGKHVATLTDQDQAQSYDANPDAFFTSLAKNKRRGNDFLLVEISERLVRSGALRGMSLHTLVLTAETDSSRQLLSLLPKHVVAPSGFDIPAGTVEPYQHISFGEDDLAEARIESTKLFKNGSELRLTIDHQTKVELATYLTGRANVTNVAIAVATAYVLGSNVDDMQEGIADIQPLAGRFERLAGQQEYSVIRDCGTEDVSVKLATESAAQLKKRRLIVATSGQLSEESLALLKTHTDRVFVTSDEDSQSAGIEIVKTASEAVDKAFRAARHDDSVLLIGPAFLDDSLFAVDQEQPKKDD